MAFTILETYIYASCFVQCHYNMLCLMVPNDEAQLINFASEDY